LADTGDLISYDVRAMTVFNSLSDALRAGFQVEDRAPNGYVVRIRTQSGWARAIVVVRPEL
jgi:hypothetical protein